MIILWILLWIFIVIIGLILFIVFLTLMPIKYKFVATTKEKISYTVKVTYLFKLFRFYYENIGGVEKSYIYIAFFRITQKKKEKQIAPKQEKTINAPNAIKKEKKEKKNTNTFQVLTDSRGKTIIKQVTGVLKKITFILLPEYIDIKGSIGLACPFRTGLFLGGYETISGMFPIIKEKVLLTGDFESDDIVFNINADIRGRFSIFRILAPIVAMVVKKPMRTILLDLWK